MPLALARLRALLPAIMRGGPCAAGPSVKLGPWRRCGLNWSHGATSSRLTQRAAEGKSARPFRGYAIGGRGRGDEQWSWLGDARRAAVLLCPKGGGVKAPPTACIARGPEGAKRRQEGDTGVSTWDGGFNHLYFSATCRYSSTVSFTRSCGPLAGSSRERAPLGQPGVCVCVRAM